MKKGKRFLRNIYTEHGTIGFEIDYDGKGVTSFSLVTNHHTEASLRTQFTEEFNESFIDTEPDPSISIEVGQYVGLTEFEFTSDYWYPLNGLYDEDFEKDPFSSLISKMTDAGGSRVSQKIQILATPVPQSMGHQRTTLAGFFSGLYQGGGDSKAESLGNRLSKAFSRMFSFSPFDKRGDLMRKFDFYSNDADKEDVASSHKDQFERIRSKAESPRYAVTIRLIAYGDSKASVSSKMHSVSKRLVSLFAYKGRSQRIKQSFKTKSQWTMEGFQQALNDTAQRYSPTQTKSYGKIHIDRDKKERFRHIKKERRSPMLISADVLAKLFHLPDPSDVNDDTVSWATETEFQFLPPEAENVDFEENNEWDDGW